MSRYVEQRDAVKVARRDLLQCIDGPDEPENDAKAIKSAIDLVYGIGMGMWHELHRIADNLELINDRRRTQR